MLSVFGAKSDYSADRIFKSENGIGKNQTEQSLLLQQYAVYTEAPVVINALRYEYSLDARTHSPHLSPARLYLPVGTCGLGPENQQE